MVSFMCDFCGKLFAEKWKFNAHKRYHYKEETECFECNDKFSNKICMQVHFQKHNLKIPSQVKCTECDSSFTSNKALLNHKRTHKIFTCSYCNKNFKRKENLDSHARLWILKQNQAITPIKSLSEKNYLFSPPVVTVNVSVQNEKVKAVNVNVQKDEIMSKGSKEILILCPVCSKQFKSSKNIVSMCFKSALIFSYDSQKVIFSTWNWCWAWKS